MQTFKSQAWVYKEDFFCIKSVLFGEVVIFSYWVQESISTITLASTDTCSLQAVTMSTVRRKERDAGKKCGEKKASFEGTGVQEKPSRAHGRGRNDERLLKALHLQAPWRDVHLTTYDTVT